MAILNKIFAYTMLMLAVSLTVMAISMGEWVPAAAFAIITGIIVTLIRLEKR